MDREKVIKGLECCIDGMLCAECGYEGIDRCFDKVLLADALSLLKEQENASKRNPVIVCPHCGKRVK